MADYLEQLPEQPVARPVPGGAQKALAAGSLPEDGQDLGGLLDFVLESVAPYPTGNGHPAFFAWINSPPSPPGVIAELLACAINATCGMGEHALMDLERGVVRDLAALAGLSATAGGVLTSGGSMANLLCLATARQWFLQRHGATDGPAYDQAHARLVAYHSDQAHMSVAKAAADIGLPPGDCAPCPPTPDRRMDLAALRAAVDRDRAAGLLPFCVVSNLGTTASGAIDTPRPLRACAGSTACDVAPRRRRVGRALGALLPELATAYRGIADLDSLTVDPHKALSVPVGCGAALVTDPEALRAASRLPRLLPRRRPGMALAVRLHDRTHPPWHPRPLTLWATLRHLGRSGVTALLTHYQDLARHLRNRIQSHPGLQLCTSGPLPVVCFRLAVPEDGTASAFHAAVAARLQQRGHAYLATVEHRGETVLRACICNHLTTTADLDTLLREVLTTAQELGPPVCDRPTR
ncbi:pyridoxal phosphate-dependent decarboxylase family protein [Streptomyces sp. L7]